MSSLRSDIIPKRVSFGLLVAFLFLVLFGDSYDPTWALFNTSVAILFGIRITASGFKERLGVNIFWVAALIYAIKLAISVYHYLYFLESNYFISPKGYFPYSYDYGQLHEFMTANASYWRGESMIPAENIDINDKAKILVAYHSLLYYFTGSYVLNFAAWSAFHTILVAFVMVWYAQKMQLSRPQLWFVFIVVALQPMFIYSDMMMRDIIGQFWLVLGLVALMTNIRSYSVTLLILPLALLFAYELRNLYVIVVLVYLVLAHSLCYESKWQKKAISIAISVAVIAIFMLAVGGEESTKISNRYFNSGGIDGSRLVLREDIRNKSLFGNLIRSLIGPFPWTQVNDKSIGWISLPADFIQCWLAMIIYISTFPLIVRRWRESRIVDKNALMWFLFFIAGAMSGAAHTVYTNVALVFLLPIAATVPVSKMLKIGFFTFCMYIFANIAYNFLGLSGAGLFQ